jgi:thiol:disulfide interchange protein
MTTGPMPSGRADARIALVALCAWLAAACAVWAQQPLPQSEATAVESASSAAGSASNAAGSGSSDGGGVVSRLRQFAGAQADAEPEFLPPEQAFKVRVTVRDAHTLAAEFVPAQGYYLYRDKIRFILPEGAPVSVAEVALPAGERKDDPNFGVTEVYHVPVRARVALARTDSAEQPIALEVRYQGCADQGLCYPPEKKVFNLLLAAAEPGAAPAAPVTDGPAD